MTTAEDFVTYLLVRLLEYILNTEMTYYWGVMA